MNPDSNQPNYDFITSQTDVASPSPKNNFKLVILVVLGVLLIITFILMSISNGSKPSSGSEPEITKKFISNLSLNSNEGYDSAVALLNKELLPGVNNYVPILQRLTSGVDISSCRYKETTSNGTVKYLCNNKVFNIKIDESSNSIIGFNISDNVQQS